MKSKTVGITAPLGFQAAGIHCGIKKSGLLDLALCVSDVSGPIAGVFTKNRVAAAPVLLDRRHLRSRRGRAIIVNSGNANACTGEQGLGAAKAMATAVAQQLSIPTHQVFVGSTGVIGRMLPIDRITTAVPTLIARLSISGSEQAAQAILTTDLKPKTVAVQRPIGGRVVTIGGMAKGSGMIHPNMATMLAYLTTDAAIAPAALQQALRAATNQSFNCMTVDGDTSTNDTVLCLANGLAKNRPIQQDTKPYRDFERLLTDAAQELALMICRDGEGVTKVVTIRVQGASTTAAAKRVADTIATSNLVKTALFGEDANWGRVMAAIGRSGVAIDPDKVTVRFDDIVMVQRGIGMGLEAEQKIAQVFKRKEFTITVQLGQGRAHAHMWTTDLSYDYVRINASYRS
ncbi:bifunctional glutamate N-acetyltransferase/amino-acid acetyltransferase ArgJ [Candidatus Nitrospira nitrificans]|uniref:Arginine biosynthesis bifunctional protein ArgJ n=1 Tax=Candidatus Nitrospira nitrificans TaxID=1742973 RepID=A0A0S4LCZ7_9BACT|nr:bifunctional glutamate N-acetyltransferase/amino-acid acetyltransferase ArgJ [Candidatus Nitrospira nitrificans]CUS34713.1 Arginine biosynthesis bifunctional protein ArgJ (Includes: Glutamate N-acetyltransferase; Amino-acid acetyltransferase) [Candidatus Nitrospira nitrificans]